MRALALASILVFFAAPARADDTVTITDDRPGEVVVDRTTRVPIVNGSAHIQLSPGDHELSIQSFERVPKPFPTRQVVGGSLIGLGVVSLVVMAGFINEYVQNQNDGRNDDLRKLYPASQTPDSLCAGSSHPAELDEVCRLNDESKKHSILAFAFGGASALFVAAGVVVLLTGGTVDRPRPVPIVGPGTAGLGMSGSF